MGFTLVIHLGRGDMVVAADAGLHCFKGAFSIQRRWDWGLKSGCFWSCKL